MYICVLYTGYINILYIYINTHTHTHTHTHNRWEWEIMHGFKDVKKDAEGWVSFESSENWIPADKVQEDSRQAR
jgi:hypothetical protein